MQTQTQFLNSVLWRASYQARAGVVCFNWPFDVSRIAHRAGSARNRSKQPSVVDGGFSLLLWPFDLNGNAVQSRYRPSIAIKSIDSKRAFKRFKGPDQIDFVDRIPEGEFEPDEEWKFRGNFLDLRTLVFALTDRGHTLESACDAFGVPYTKRDVRHGVIRPENVEYCREDVDATARLCEAALNEFLRHPVDLQATDDVAETGDYIAVIRGRGEPKSKKMFGPGDPLPAIYEEFRTALYSDHIRVPGAWSKIGVLANVNEPEVMLNHALVQARRRGDV